MPGTDTRTTPTIFRIFRTQERRHALLEAPLFRDLPRPARSAVLRMGCELHVHTGSVLARPAVRAREVLVVLEGQAVASEDGRPVARFGPGDVIGDMAAVNGAPVTATVTAETRVRLIVFDLREFISLLHAAPEVERRLYTRAS